MAEKKMRLDLAVAARGLAENRSKAAALIMAGQVYVNEQKASKSGDTVKESDTITVRGEKMPFVSRGGYKLDKAIRCFSISLQNTVCMDIGASTGGFSDCMLQNGAKKVYAVDVGYGQLAWKLRTDARIINMERTNFRYLTPADIAEPLDFASVDVSFISLKIILPVLHTLLRPNAEAVCLIKPQFEAGRELVGKKGVVRDRSVHESVVRTITEFAFENGFSVLNLSYSPIKGPEGNIEYLLHIQKSDAPQVCACNIADLVDESHNALK